MSRFLSPRFAGLSPYVPGEQPRDMRYVKLNTNESPFPPAPGVMKAISRDEVARLNLYSDPTARALEDAIAAWAGLDPAQVIATNGSDEALAFSFQAFCDANVGCCFPDISYGFYRVYAQLYGIDALEVPLTEDLRIDPADYARVGRTIFLANPNAPTGQTLGRDAVEGIVRANPERVVVVDEAYIAFGGESMVPLIGTYPNLLVIQTFSKARNLAGARIGYAVGQASLIEDLRAMKYSFNPYNLNRLSILAGTAAMMDEAYYQECTTAIAATRDWAADALAARGFMLTDSKANFVFARHPRLDGYDYYARLKARGVLVRHFGAPRIRDYVRITIGTRDQMENLLAATDAILAEAP